MPNRNPLWPSLPLAEWPPLDKAAYDAAMRRGGPLDAVGSLTKLSSKTLRTSVGVYGQFLAWLARRDLLDAGHGPSSRVTREHVSQFFVERRSTASANTIFNQARMLQMFLAHICPEQKWTWIAKQTVIPRRNEAMSSRHEPAVVDLRKLWRWLFAEMNRLKQEPVTSRTAVRYRDCMITALTFSHALRMRNMLALSLDDSFQRLEHGWRIRFDRPGDIKGRTGLEMDVRQRLVPFVDTYVDVYRSFLIGDAPPHRMLWVSHNGHPLRVMGFRLAFQEVCRDAVGKHVKPHNARHTLATEVLRRKPESLGLVAFALGHSDTSHVTDYYDRSHSKGARQLWAELVADLSAEPEQGSK